MNTDRRTFLVGGSAAAALSAQQRQSDQPKIRLGIIGTGHRVWALLECIKAIPDIQVVSMADISPAFLDKAATIAGGKPATYSDYNKMLAEQKLDAVLVATPGGLHAPPVVAAFAKGLHVMSEKPIAVTVEDANRMIDAGRKAGKLLQVAHQMRYSPPITKMREMIDQGAIGQPRYAAGYLFRGDWNPASWKAPNPKTGKPTVWRYMRSMTGSSLIEDGIHEMDVLHWMLGGKIKQMYATGGNDFYKDRETIDHAALIAEYENGMKMTFDFNMLVGGRNEKLNIIGTDGMLETDGESLFVQKRGAAALKPVTFPNKTPKLSSDVPNVSYNLVGSYWQIMAFVENVRKNKKPLTDGETSKETIKIALLAQKSIDEKRMVKWSELPA